MNKSSLIVRVALGVGGTAVAVALFCTYVFYQLTVKQEIKVSTQQADSLFATVRRTAASAAYLGEQGTDLAQELVDGLTNNEMVASAHMQFSGLQVNSGINDTTTVQPEIYNIYSIFQPDQKSGELHLYLDREYVQSRAENIAQGSALAMLFLAFLITLLVMVAAYFLVTRPLSRIAKTLHNIEPGTEGRLTKAGFHQRSELGSLVDDINLLLNKTELQLKSERQLRGQIEGLEKKFRLMFQNSMSPIVLADAKGNILLQNLAFGRLLDSVGAADSTQHGPLLCDLFASPTAMLNSIVPTLKTNNVALGEFKLKTPANQPGCWVQMVVSNFISDDASEYQQITLHDISTQHEELKALSIKAQYDPLTELLNRHGLENKLDEKASMGQPFTLVLFDLNWFKQVNDRYGHSAGDSILKYIAEGIHNSLSPGDIGGRWGGDEFVLIIDGNNRQRVTNVCEQLIGFITQPYQLKEFETEVIVGASMGAAMFPQHKTDIKELVALADKAMYAAKGFKSRNKHDEFLIFADNDKLE